MTFKTNFGWLKPAGIAAVAGLAVTGMAAGAVAADKVEVKVGITTAEDSIIGRNTVMWGQMADAQSDGNIDIKLFPAGQLGKGKTQIEGIIAGTHDVFIHISQYTGKVPEVRFWDLPFLFTNINQVTRVVYSGMRENLETVFDCHGMVYLGTWGYGYRQFTGSKEITRPADLQGQKHRIPGGKSKMVLFESLGADPSTVAFPELYQALKTGVVDSQDNPLATIYTSKFHEVATNMSVLNYVYNPNIIAAGKPFWDKLDDKTKAILTDTSRIMEGWSLQQGVVDDMDYLARIQESNPDLKINYLDESTLPEWQEAAKPVYDFFREDTNDAWADAVFEVIKGGYWKGVPEDQLPSC